MATREIKATLALDGEKQFSSQIKAAQRNLRAMRAEVKAEAAEFEASGNAMAANEARLKSLAAQQKQQEVIVKALEQAVKEAAEKFGENSAQVDNYRMRLASARAELAQMESQQRKLSEANKQTAKSFDDLKKDVASNWKQVAADVEGALKGITATAAGVFAAVSAAAIGAGKTVVGWAVDASNQADELLTEAEITGIDPVTLQQWQYASRFIDTSVDTITGSIKKLRRGMENENVANMIQGMGVSITDSAGNLRQAADVFWDIVDVVSSNPLYGDTTETDNLLTNILGKGYDDLKPLIHTGRNAWEQLGLEAENRDIIMDEDTLAAYGELNDVLQNIDAMMKAIPTSIASYFLPGITDAATQVDEFLTVFNRFLHGDATADDVAKEASDVIGAVIHAVEEGIKATEEIIGALKASDDPNVRAIGELLDGIKGSLQWMWENKDGIVTAVEAIIGVWVAGSITSALANIGTFAGHVGSLVTSVIDLIAKAPAYKSAMTTIQGASGLGAAGAAGAGAAGAGAAAGKGAKVLPFLGGLLKFGSAAYMGNLAYEWATGNDGIAHNSEADPAWLAYINSPQYQDDLIANPYSTWAHDEDMEAARQAAEEIGEEANRHYKAADHQMYGIAESASDMAADVGDTMADLEQWINLNNWQRAMQRGEDPTATVDDANYIIDALAAIDAKYGGDILGNTKEGKSYLGILQSMSAGPLDSLPTIDAVFALQPADGTEEAIEATVGQWHFEAPLYLTPVGGFSSSDFMSGLSSMASGGAVGGTANLQINLDSKVIGRAVAPVVDSYLGAKFTR